MADNARRSLYKVTYAPIKPSEEDRRSGIMERRMRGLEKVTFVASLRATKADIEAARRVIGGDAPADGAPI